MIAKKVKIKAALTAVTLCGSMSPALAGEPTISQPIKQLRYSTEYNLVYMAGESGWGAPSCPGAVHAQFFMGSPNFKNLMAVILLAKAQGSKVSFFGECAPDPYYFNVSYVVVD
ncbi:hypothetical protein CDN99_19785 [Roseateles aquatilis]|uniref:Uncharacterized protein n=1 Tax=Roseateles aquatilis TaxID=431061 RepID=A0A246J2Y3_9BURK|nr:hypothetical protein [Roseateles aquatilis]OWQ86945.1 hypothetical protein CDN99_19785 [Roseateles aquatilis]